MSPGRGRLRVGECSSMAIPGLPPLPAHPCTWLHLSPSAVYTHICLPQPHPSRPSPLRPNLLSWSHVVGSLSGGTWRGSGPTRHPPLPILKLSQRKGWGLHWALHDASSLGRKPRRGGSDTFLDLPTQPPRTMPQARQGFLAPPSGSPHQ